MERGLFRSAGIHPPIQVRGPRWPALSHGLAASGLGARRFGRHASLCPNCDSPLFEARHSRYPPRKGARGDLALYGSVSMERFIRRENVRHFRELLDRVTDEAERRRILKLLEEEQRKQHEAGDKAEC